MKRDTLPRKYNKTQYKALGAVKLKPMELAFCEAYATSGSARDAALAAGYSVATAGNAHDKIMRRPQIIAEIKRLRKITKKIVDEEVGDTFEWKMRKLMDVVRAGIPDNAVNATVKDAMSAIDILCKMEGHFSAEKRINTNVNVEVEKQEVNAILKGLREQYKSDY